jgi:hypothetical protein
MSSSPPGALSLIHSSSQLHSFNEDVVLFSEENEKILHQMQSALNTTAAEAIETQKKIDATIREYYSAKTKLNDMMVEIGLKIGEIDGDFDVWEANFNFMKDLTEQIGSRYFTTSIQYMELQKLNREGKGRQVTTKVL